MVGLKGEVRFHVSEYSHFTIALWLIYAYLSVYANQSASTFNS